MVIPFTNIKQALIEQNLPKEEVFMKEIKTGMIDLCLFDIENGFYKISTVEMYEVYKDWCKEKGVNQSTEMKFSKEFAKKSGYESKRVRVGKRQVNCYFVKVDIDEE